MLLTAAKCVGGGGRVVGSPARNHCLPPLPPSPDPHPHPDHNLLQEKMGILSSLKRRAILLVNGLNKLEGVTCNEAEVGGA